MISLLLFAEQTTENSVEVSGWEIASVIITAVTAILSLLLTFYVHKQTQKNSKNMENISLEMAKRDEEYKKMQLKLQQREGIERVYKLLRNCSIFAKAILNSKNEAEDLYHSIVNTYDVFWEYFSTTTQTLYFELNLYSQFVGKEHKEAVAKLAKDCADLFSKVNDFKGSKELFEKEINNVIELANSISNTADDILPLIKLELSLTLE